MVHNPRGFKSSSSPGRFNLHMRTVQRLVCRLRNFAQPAWRGAHEPISLNLRDNTPTEPNVNQERPRFRYSCTVPELCNCPVIQTRGCGIGRTSHNVESLLQVVQKWVEDTRVLSRQLEVDCDATLRLIEPYVYETEQDDWVHLKASYGSQSKLESLSQRSNSVWCQIWNH